MLPVLNKPLIELVYRQEAPDEPIQLRELEIEFQADGSQFVVNAQPSIRFAPSPRLEFAVHGNVPCSTGSSCVGKIFGEPIELKIAKRTSGVDGPSAIVVPAAKAPLLTNNANTQIANAKFHLFNFPNCFGNQDYSLGEQTGTITQFKRCGLVRLAVDNWEIAITARSDVAEVCGTLEMRGGHVITHVGEIKTLDGSTFTWKSLSELLEILWYFLSFATGRKTGVALPVGFDTNGNVIVEEWNLPMMSAGPWNGGLAWFDLMNADCLSMAFPGFCKMWQNKTWHQTI